MNTNKLFAFGCMTFFVSIIAALCWFAIKTTLLWAVWNWSYELIPILNGPISWFGSCLLILIINIIKINYNYNRDNS